MPTITEETPRVNFTINKKQFSVPAPYAAGHVLTAGEASAMNQTFRENIRNNNADNVDKWLAGTPAEGDKPAIEPLTIEQVQAKLDEYASDYEFGERSTAAPRMDPVEREARSMVKEAVTAMLTSQGKKPKDMAEGVFDKLLAAAWESNKDKALARAQDIIDQRKGFVLPGMEDGAAE